MGLTASSSLQQLPDRAAAETAAAHPHVDVGHPGEVARFYRGRSILVTGATGYMGKVLVEKLLRECPDVAAIYVLLRPAGGRQVGERLRELLDTPVFETVRRRHPQSLSKLVAVHGDAASPGLGLSPSDRVRLTEAVSVVFHLAASVRFNEHLRAAFDVNVRGTQAVLQLCRGMSRLAALVHVSTAFCNCTRDRVEEAVYPPPMPAAELQRLLDGMDDKQVEEVTPGLLGGLPNTYTFTKAVAEALVVDEAKGLPVVIVRPSIVVPAWREPSPGWVDSLNGPLGPWVAIGQGTLRCVFGDGAKVADLVPVDVCINLALAAAWHRHALPEVAQGRPNPGVMVYHSVSGATNPVTWGAVTAKWVDAVRERPYARALMYPTASFTRSRLYHRLCTSAGVVLPAHLLDIVGRLKGEKFKGLAARISRQNRAMRPFDFFTSHEWAFPDDNARSLWSRMGAADRAAFPFGLGELDWGEYVKVVLDGTKRFILKEGRQDPQTQSAVRARLERMYMFHRLLTLLSLPLPVAILAARPLFSKL